MASDLDAKPVALGVAVLTVSDTRGAHNDSSGDFLTEACTSAGHTVVDRTLVRDDVYAIRAVLSRWIADSDVHAVLITGMPASTAYPTTDMYSPRYSDCQRSNTEGAGACGSVFIDYP